MFKYDNPSTSTNCDILGYKVISGCNCSGTIFESNTCYDNCDLSCRDCYTGQIIIGDQNNNETITVDVTNLDNNWNNRDTIINCYTENSMDKEKLSLIILAIILAVLCVLLIPIYICLELTEFICCCCC